MKFRKGAVDWTVGKLLSYVLLIIVLVLVIYGFSTGGFIPLKDKIMGQIDEALILLHFKDDPGKVECVLRKVNIEGIGEGAVNLCKSYCEFSIIDEGADYKGFPKYKLGEGKFTAYLKEGGEYSGNVGITNVELAEKAREAYPGLIDVIKQLDFLPDESEEKEINLAMGFIPTNVLEFKVKSGNYQYRWEKDHWVMLHAGQPYSPYPEKNALNELYESYVGKEGVSWGYRMTGANMIPLTNDQGASQGFSFKPIKNEELFNNWVLGKKEEWNMNFYLYEEALKKLNENSKEIHIKFRGKEFPYHVSEKFISGIHSVPIIYFDGSNDERWGLFFNSTDNKFHITNGEKFTRVDFDPFVRLDENSWTQVKQNNLIYQYLSDYCN